MGGQIVARVLDETNGLKVFYDVSAIRIKSKDYVLLIMQDYISSLGDIDGNVVIVTNGEEIPYKGIKGFYEHQHNQFTLLITVNNYNINNEDFSDLD